MLEGQNKELSDKISHNIIRFMKACHKLGRCTYKHVVGAVELYGIDAVYDEYKMWVKDGWKIFRLKYQENHNPVLIVRGLLGKKILNLGTNSGIFWIFDKEELSHLLSILDTETIIKYEVDADFKKQNENNEIDKILEGVMNDQGDSYSRNDLPDMYES